MPTPLRLSWEEQKRRTWTVFGATGFTGCRIAREIVELMSNGTIPSTVVLCLAGRDEEKLQQLKDKLMDEFKGVESRRIRMLIEINVDNEESLQQMAQASFMVLNAVGPYRFYGEPVVKACVENGAHYLDVSGEPEFMERVQAKYHDQAKEKHLVIVSSCAFDSALADLGASKAVEVFHEKYPDADLEKVNETLTVESGPSGFQGHFATYESAVHGIASVRNLKELRKSQDSLPKKKVIGKYNEGGSTFFGAQWNPVLQKWTLPFPGSDASVVRRTQKHDSKLNASGIFSFSARFGVPSRLNVLAFYFFGFVVQMLAKFSLGRWMLLKFPQLFTKGLFSHEGPSETQMKETKFTILLQCFGLEKKKEQQVQRSLKFFIHGPEPGYVATPRIISSCARALHDELDKIAIRGVLTPSVAFRHTHVMEYMQTRGITQKSET